MAKFNEETLTGWTKPPSKTEKSKLENAERMVKEAINEDEKLKLKSIEIFGQGSYANNTNVKINSDIDINVRYSDGFFFSLPDNTTESDIGIDGIPSTNYTYHEYKNDIENALVNKFGQSNIIRNDKCITVIGNSYRVETDVVPTWNFRRYRENGSYVLGARFWSDAQIKITNYPKQHIENGIEKNSNTSRKFKRLTRLHRKLRYKMIEDKIDVNDNITSFSLECLVWNVPNNIFNNNTTWNERLKQSIIFLYQNTKKK